jgi:hypothetical protein
MSLARNMTDGALQLLNGFYKLECLSTSDFRVQKIKHDIKKIIFYSKEKPSKGRFTVCDCDRDCDCDFNLVTPFDLKRTDKMK